MATRIEFDGWTLLPATGELWRDGSRRRLQTQAVRVLLLWLRRPGELVAREELVQDLWPDTVVDYEAGLNAVIRKLRVALDDDAEDPRYIETIPRRGYRFAVWLAQPEQEDVISWSASICRSARRHST